MYGRKKEVMCVRMCIDRASDHAVTQIFVPRHAKNLFANASNALNWLKLINLINSYTHTNNASNGWATLSRFGQFTILPYLLGLRIEKNEKSVTIATNYGNVLIRINLCRSVRSDVWFKRGDVTKSVLWKFVVFVDIISAIYSIERSQLWNCSIVQINLLIRTVCRANDECVWTAFSLVCFGSLYSQ